MYSPRWLFLVPGAAMVLLGLILATALVAGPRPIGHNINLDLNSFIGASFLVVVGAQFVTFGAIARVFAMRAGFLPRSRRAEFLFGWLSTDRLVQIAGALLVLGVAGVTWAVWQWMKVDFGTLNSPVVPRIMVSSLCTVIVAIQTAGSAFLLGILEIPFDRRT
jgi:hypothetical protein